MAAAKVKAGSHALALRGHHTRPLKLLVPPAETYDDSYYEGWYVELLHRIDGRPVHHTLTGDGV